MAKKLNLISTKVALAKHCGMSRQGLDVYLKMPGAPVARSNGFWDGDEVVAWVNSHSATNDDELERLKLQKLRNEVAQSELDLMKSSDEVMPIEFVSRVLAHQAICFRNIIQGSGLTDEQKETMTNAVLAIDTDKFIAEMFAEAGARSAPGARNGGEADE
jgi:hypothetical protein